MQRKILFFLFLSSSIATAFAGNFVKWVDKNGTIHFADSIDKVPLEFRSQLETISGRSPGKDQISKITTFSFRPNSKQIVVSPKLNDTVVVKMLVDTGATQSVISKKVAVELGVDPNSNKLQSVEMETANGKVKVPVIKIETVALEARVAKNLYVTINDQVESENYSGLLGQDFLKNFKMTYEPALGKLSLEDK